MNSQILNRVRTLILLTMCATLSLSSCGVASPTSSIERLQRQYGDWISTKYGPFEIGKHQSVLRSTNGRERVVLRQASITSNTCTGDTLDCIAIYMAKIRLNDALGFEVGCNDELTDESIRKKLKPEQFSDFRFAKTFACEEILVGTYYSGVTGNAQLELCVVAIAHVENEPGDRRKDEVRIYSFGNHCPQDPGEEGSVFVKGGTRPEF